MYVDLLDSGITLLLLLLFETHVSVGKADTFLIRCSLQVVGPVL